MSDTLLAFKAGRAFRRDGSNSVEPSPTKGAIICSKGDDELLHFMWKNRATDRVEEDLILFPSDATFTKRHFFWMQDASSARDEEFAENVNGLLQDPDYELVWNTSRTSQPSSSTHASSAVGGSGFQATPEQIAALESALTQISGRTTAQPELSLTDVLTPTNLTPLFQNHPELIPSLFPHLPADLPVPPSAEAIQRIIHSPQFRAAVSNFDQALRTGMLGGLVRGLGLPDEAGTGIGPFLRAVQEQADRENTGSGTNRMDTD